MASMGIGFQPEHPPSVVVPRREMEVPGPDYGLTPTQMRMLGLTNDGTASRMPEVKAVRVGGWRWCGST